MSKVLVLYDFEAEPNSSEMTIRSGEILTVTNTNVGEGWWEGQNPSGQRGLFPAAYVEAVAANYQQNQPAPPPPPAVADIGGQDRYDQVNSFVQGHHF